jgi:hypothetical protein
MRNNACTDQIREEMMSVQDETRSTVPRRTRIAIGLAAVVGLVLAGLIGYAVRTNGSGTGVLSGRAYVGSHQASIILDDRAYGFPVSDGSITWYDARGSLHDGGVAPCLRHAGTYAQLRFGTSVAHGRDGVSWREVTWVQCSQHQ